MGITTDQPGLFTLALLANPFPTTETSYYSSLWFTWVERIMLSHDAHADEIIATHGGSDRIENQQQYEDGILLYTITESMYAALLIAAQSNIEIFFKNLCRCIYLHINRTQELYAINSKVKLDEKANQKDIEKYIKKNINISISSVGFFHIADAVRILANTFKHNQSKYTPREFNSIDKKIAQEIGVAEGQQVIYSDLPLKDLLIGCGRYCQALKIEVMEAIKLC